MAYCTVSVVSSIYYYPVRTRMDTTVHYLLEHQNLVQPTTSSSLKFLYPTRANESTSWYLYLRLAVIGGPWWHSLLTHKKIAKRQAATPPSHTKRMAGNASLIIVYRCDTKIRACQDSVTRSHYFEINLRFNFLF